MRTAAVVALLLVLIVLMAAVRLHTYDEPLEMDAATYAVIARELRAGRYLYSELWDHKPPAIHATFAVAQVLAGSGPAHAYLLALAAASVALLGVYAGAAAAAGRGVGLLAAAFWAIVSADLGLQANQPNAEVFINAAVVWGWALLIAMPVTRRAAGRALFVGALFALASLYKHVAAVTAGALLVTHLAVASRTAAERRRAAVQMGLGAAVVAAAWGAVSLYFAASGRFDDFWGAVVTFNRHYAGSGLTNLQEGLVLDRLLAPALYPVLPLLVVALLGALSGGGWRGRAGPMLAAYAVATAVAVALPGRFHPHYYQLWLPVLAVAGAYGLALLRPVAVAPGAWLLRAGAAVAAILVAIQLPSLGATPDEWSRRKFGERLLRNVATARAVDVLLLPDETFFEWGHEAELYYYSGRRPPAGEFRSEHLLNGPRAPQRTARLLADLARRKPELVLISSAHPFPLDHPVPQWLLQHYAELGRAVPGLATPDFLVLIRRGGALEHRLLGGADVAAAGAR